MVHDGHEVDSESHTALISIAEDKSELCPIDHAIQDLDSKVTDQVFDNCNYSQHSGHSDKNTITHHSQVEQQQLAKMAEHNQKELNDNAPCNTKDKSFYTDKRHSNLDTVMNSINVSENFNNHYDIILEDGNRNNLPEQTVLYIMNLMFNDIYLRLIEVCNNTLDIVKKHKTKIKDFNPEKVESQIEQFKILRENIDIELNKLLIEHKPGVQHQNILTLLHEQPELLFIQIIYLQNSLKELELPFSEDINDIIESLQKCINIANTLLLSNTEQISFQDTNTKNAKKPFDRLMNITSVANMLCDSLAAQDIAGANPQYFRNLNTKVNKIKKGLYTNNFIYDVFFDYYNNKYTQAVNSIFSNNTLCLDTLEKIHTNIRNYTTRDTFDSSQKSATNAEIKFLSAGVKFIVEKIDAMIEPYFKPKDVVCNSKTTKQQNINNKHYSINNAYMRNINTQYTNALPSLNINTLKDQNQINIHSSEIENPSLQVKTKRSTDTDTAHPSNESNLGNLTSVVVDVINSNGNNTFASIESEESTHDITQDTPNDLINEVNVATKLNVQTAYAESKIAQEDHTEHVANQATTNVNEESTHDITQDTPNDLINEVNIATKLNVQTAYTELQIVQEDHTEHVANRTNINVKANYLASTSEQYQKIIVTSKSTSAAKKLNANVSSVSKKYINLYPYSVPLADIAVRPDITTTGTFTSITHKHPIHSTINNTRTVQLNDKDATYYNYNINNSNSRTYHITTTYQSSVNTIPVVNIYNEANITNNTTATFGEYNTKTLNNNVNYIIGHRKSISNNLAQMQPDNLILYNGIAIEVGTLQPQPLYYNITLPSNIIYHPKLLKVSNSISSYKSSQDKEEKVKKRACDKILIDHKGSNVRKDYYSFLDALNYGHKLFNIILTRTNTYQELHKKYPNKSIKELLLTSSLINNLDADERQNLTNIYMSITTNILGFNHNTQHAQRMSFGTKLQPLILKHERENLKYQIAYTIDGLAIDIQTSKLQIDDIEQDVILRTASIPTYIDPQLGIKSISLAFTDSFGHMPLESEVLYMSIHYDNTGNIVASHYPPTMQFIGNQPVIRTLKGNYFGPCTRDTIQQLERHIPVNESYNRVLSASMAIWILNNIYISDNISTF